MAYLISSESVKGPQPVATGWDSLNANAYANRHGRFGGGGLG